ncbi:MAG TPA: hypothetical protein VFQ92_20975 [Blastocatellia bacterium]|nr:hypothetical protein [Blastocatellia bacterium]
MKSANTLLKKLFLVILTGALMGSPGDSVKAQSNEPLRLEFVGIGGGPPDVVVLGDGTVIFKITAIQSATGDLTGTLTERITQVYPASDEEGLLPITTFWSLVTTEGTIEGYYAGKFDHLKDGNHMIIEHGEILSVTGAYAALYQATVTYKAVLGPDHMTIAGTMTIRSRNKR